MNEQIVEKNKILEVNVGSFLYGTNVATSDVDRSGVFIPTISYYFGLDKVEECDLSFKSKLDNGRNDSDAIDRKFYEFKRFVKLSIENNPNIIEQVFVNKENIVFINDLGQALLDQRFNFLHKGLKDRFIGYAISQKKKMYVKRDNMCHIEEGIAILDKLTKKTYIAEQMGWLLDAKSRDGGWIFKDAGNQHIQCGDIHIQKNITVDRALEQLEDRKSKFSGRKEMVDEYGYDTKFAMHLIRLLLEGKELLETGDLKFPLKEKPLLMDIRGGKYSIAEIDQMATEIENSVTEAFDKSDLPSKPRYDLLNTFCTETLQDFFRRV